MVSIWLLIPVFFGGAVFGMLIAALCIAGGKNEEH